MPKQVSVSELQRQIEELETERGLFFNIVFTVEKVGWTQADYENHLQRLEWNQIINPVKPCIIPRDFPHMLKLLFFLRRPPGMPYPQTWLKAQFLTMRSIANLRTKYYENWVRGGKTATNITIVDQGFKDLGATIGKAISDHFLESQRR